MWTLPLEDSISAPSTPDSLDSSARKRLGNVNITHVTPAYEPVIEGGISTFVQNLAQVTSRNTDASVRVLVTDIEWGHRDKTSFRDGAVDVFHIMAVKIGFIIVPVGLSSYVTQADIIHIHDPFFSLVTFASVLFAKPSAKIIMSTHGGFFHTKRWSALKQIYFNSICRLISSRYCAITADSKQDFASFSTISNRVTLIECGVEIEKFDIGSFHPKANRFLFVGRLAHNKNIEALIDVYLKLRNTRSDISLDIVGEDPYGIWKTIIAHKLAKTPRVEINYHGKLDDRSVVDMMRNAKFFMFASSYEGFGIAVVEAMAAGCIPIVNDIQPMRDLIKNDQTGFIVDFKNVRGAADAIDAILNYPPLRLEQISDAARLFSRKFSWENVGNAFIEVYEKCLQCAE